MKIAIFTEDRYGPKFIRRIINNLILHGRIKSSIEFYKPYTPSQIEKCHNVGVKVKSVIRDVDRVLIIIDKENVDNYDEEREIWRHLRGLSPTDRNKIYVISTNPEIEEWICISLRLSFDESGYDKNEKPSKILKNKYGYGKGNLPEFADKIDYEYLYEKSESFKRLIISLTQ